MRTALAILFTVIAVVLTMPPDQPLTGGNLVATLTAFATVRFALGDRHRA
jgi:hypothetical protein